MSALSNYLYRKTPDFYGGKQEEYLNFSEQTINQGVSELASGVQANKNLSELFFGILETFQKKSSEIAIKHENKKAELFGKPRNKKNAGYPGAWNTGLYSHYEEYNEIVKKQIQNLSPQDLEVVRRCIHNYSQSPLNTILYRWEQWQKSYLDWKQSSKILDQRKYSAISDKGNPSSTIVGNILVGPWMALDYMLQESGEARLKRLIKEKS